MIKIGILLFVVIMVIVVIFVAFYHGLVIKNYQIQTEKFDKGKAVRVVLIADLHSHIYKNQQGELIEQIKKQKPDVILLAGDIADDHTPIEGTKLLLEGIKDMVSVFYVSGNHEYWSRDIDNIKKMIREYGVTVLEDEYQEIEINDQKILIAGIDDPDKTLYGNEDYDQEKSMDQAFSNLSENSAYKILIAHKPEQIELYKKYPFDLVVSGHTHGGQVRIPFLINGLFAPNQGLFPKYGGGLYQHETITQIVSRGVSYKPDLPRIFNPPEIVVIDIQNKT